MGADLVGYIYVGPQKIEGYAKRRAIKELKGLISQVKRYRGVTDHSKLPLVLEDFDNDPEAFLKEFPGADAGKQATKFVNLFCQFWEGKLWVRDRIDRYYATGEEVCDKKIVVVADLSYGDEPDGQGYRLMKMAALAGITEVLGLR